MQYMKSKEVLLKSGRQSDKERLVTQENVLPSVFLSFHPTGDQPDHLASLFHFSPGLRSQLHSLPENFKDFS